MPRSGGAVVVDALACTLVLVLLVGHYGLYRLGLQQIDLAIQRSDFVSAVSHELQNAPDCHSHVRGDAAGRLGTG